MEKVYSDRRAKNPTVEYFLEKHRDSLHADENERRQQLKREHKSNENNNTSQHHVDYWVMPCF